MSKQKELYWGSEDAEPIQTSDYAKEKAELEQWLTMNQDLEIFRVFIESTDKWLEEVSGKQYHRYGWLLKRLWDEGVRGKEILVETAALTLYAHRNKRRIVSERHFIHVVGNKVIRLVPYPGTTTGKEHYGIGLDVLKHLNGRHTEVCRLYLEDQLRTKESKKAMGTPLEI